MIDFAITLSLAIANLAWAYTTRANSIAGLNWFAGGFCLALSIAIAFPR